MLREKAKQFGMGLRAGGLFRKIELGKRHPYYSELSITEVTGKYLFQRLHIHYRTALEVSGKKKKTNLISSSQHKNRRRVRIASIKWTCFQPALSTVEIYAEKEVILALASFCTETMQSHAEILLEILN